MQGVKEFSIPVVGADIEQHGAARQGVSHGGDASQMIDQQVFEAQEAGGLPEDVWIGARQIDEFPQGEHA